MSYQSGTVATATQLLDALRTFAVAQGWSELRWGAQGTGYQLSLQKGTRYVHLRSATAEALRSGAVTGIALTASTGWDSGQPWNNQPGRIIDTYNGGSVTAYSGLFNVSAANTYRLFGSSTPDQIMLVAEVSPGRFHHLAFGELEKFGAFNGGEWVRGGYTRNRTDSGGSGGIFGGNFKKHPRLPLMEFGVDTAAFVRAEVDAVAAWYTLQGGSSPVTGKAARSIWRDALSTPYGVSAAKGFLERAPNTLNGVTPMLPWQIWVDRPSNMLSPIGRTPHLRYLNITQYAAAEVFALGAEQWMAFPAHTKNGYSGVHGYAVRYQP